MKTEHRAIIAIVLSAGFFFLWTTVINPPKKAPEGQAAPTEQVAAATAQAEKTAATAQPAVETKAKQAAAAGAVQDPQASIPEKSVTIKNNLVEMDISNDGGVVTSWRLPEYRQTTDKTSPPTDLAATSPELPAPLLLEMDGATVQLPAKPRFEVIEADYAKVVLGWKSGDLVLTKTISIQEGNYVADVLVEVANKGNKAFSAKPAIVWSGVNTAKKSGGFFGFLKGQQQDIKQPVYYLDGKAHRTKDVTAQVAVPGLAYWSGLESRYFISAVIPRVSGEGLEVKYGGGPLAGAEAGATGLWAGVELPAMTVPAGETVKAAFSVYAGPKDIERLKALGVRLEDAIDYGWFTIVAMPILYLLKFFYKIINNYGVAIILLTIFVKLLLHPINIKSLKSMKAMQQLQPRLKELQAKYKDDKQRLNVETMQLFRAHKVNPMGGCLPMVAQLPIYIALYKVLWSSIELYHAPFFWFYKDLSAPDPYLITPILLGVFMVAQQMLTPSTSGDPAQRKMMMFMPIMFTGFMLFLPAGLVIYILVNTAMSVTQQWMYNHGIGFMDLMKGRWKQKLAAAMHHKA